MCRLLVLVSALVALFAFGPMGTLGQEATPPADMTAAATLTRTDTRYVVPFTPDGLNPGLNVTSATEGACTWLLHREWSSRRLGLHDQWRRPRPLFRELVCRARRGNRGGLPRYAVVHRGRHADLDHAAVARRSPAGALTGAADTADEVIQPWDLPWALELANGDRCALLHGTLLVMAGQVVHYGCEQGGMILGETDHTQPVWTVSYVAAGEVASNLVDVVTAWT